MKKTFILIVAFFTITISKAQSYNLKNFDKLEFNNINGSVDIELAKDFNIEIVGLPKNSDLITVKLLPENKLSITLKKGLSWDAMKDIRLIIKISMPEISKLSNNSNANISINNFIGRYFGVENNGNGNVEIEGNVVDLLDIENNGNGDCNAKQIEAKEVNITKVGNGDVIIKTNANFKTKLAGNGDVINYGNGKAIMLKQSGNGKVVYRN
jgi:hypothetical protein